MRNVYHPSESSSALPRSLPPPLVMLIPALCKVCEAGLVERIERLVKEKSE